MRNRRKKVLPGILLFFLTFLTVFLGVQFLTKTGLFKEPGKVIFDESVSSFETELLDDIFNENDVKLDSDVTISSASSFNLANLNDNDYLIDIKVPVTDYYSLETDISASSPEELLSGNHDFDVSFEMIDINELSFDKKLLSINNDYFLDDFNKGAVFRVLSFESDKFNEEIKPLVDEGFSKVFPNKDNTLSMAQTGVTALSRGMYTKLNEVENASYFSEGLKTYLSSFDLTHTSNEASFSDYATSNNICSDPRFLNTLLDIGLDIVELTGNHNLDCGDDDAINTIDIYNSNKVKVVGGGKNADEAAKPLVLNEKGNNITFLAYNLSTGGATDDDTPGANRYDEEDAVFQISTAKERGDFVIVDIQYYECSAYVSSEEDTTCDYADSAAGDQVGFFRHLIDLGADLVVGTSAHQPQTFELYGDGAIYYGLGNLFFDQAWWPGTSRSLILEHYFYNGKLLQTRIKPTVYDTNLQTSLMDEDLRAWFLARLINERP